MIQNLVVNATEHSKEGSTITLEFIDTSETYRIIVKDEGEGFDSVMLANAQKKYVSKPSAVNTTYGLGVYIVRALLEQYGGQLFVANYTAENGVSGASVTCEFEK